MSGSRVVALWKRLSGSRCAGVTCRVMLAGATAVQSRLPLFLAALASCSCPFGTRVQVVNAFLPDVVSLAYPSRVVSYHILSRFARSQAYLDALVAPVEFSLALRFAAAIKTISLSILYAPILPLSPIIGAVAILFSYMTDMCVSSPGGAAPAFPKACALSTGPIPVWLQSPRAKLLALAGCVWPRRPRCVALSSTWDFLASRAGILRSTRRASLRPLTARPLRWSM